MKPDFWSSFQNQALLSQYESSGLGINYQNRFGLAETGTATAGFILHRQGTSLGLIYSHFGYRDFTRHSAGIAGSLNLSEKISAGVQVDFCAERTPGEYNERRTLTFETGIFIIPSENVRIGIHVFNPVPNSLRKSYLPLNIRTGAGIFLGRSLFASAEAEMSTGRAVVIKTGFEFEAGNDLFVRAGFSSENYSFSFGAGYLIRDVRFDLGFSSHQNLGISSSVSIIFNIKVK
jgi:hypothetical protein